MKPFKGAIYDWHLYDNRIYGKCLFHTTYENDIVDALPMITSDVVKIDNTTNPTVRIVETRNSRYLLV